MTQSSSMRVAFDTYSQRGEDLHIQQFFEGFTGNLLDIGANNGVLLSNSRALLENGWTGTMIEPCVKTFHELLNNYPEPNYKPGQIRCCRIAIGETTGYQKFFESGTLYNEDDHALVSTLIEGETDRWRKAEGDQHPVDYIETKVFVMTWKDFYVSIGSPQFDFVTIDAEGMDLSILKQMDLKAMGVKCLCVEYNGKDEDLFNDAVNMPQIHKNKTNIIYGRNII